jgi:hypothetical protein
VRRDVVGVGVVEKRTIVTLVDMPLVSFRETFTFPDGSVLTSSSTLRFRGRGELERSVTDAGFEVIDVRQAPDRPGREYVFVCRRT